LVIYRRPAHALKLTQAKEFKAVLAALGRLSGKHFVMKADVSGLSGARLGLIASRKAARRAVDRNRAKRLARVAFCQQRADLPPLDFVLQLKNDMRQSGNAEIHEELARLLRDAAKRFGTASAMSRASRAPAE